MTQSVDVKKLMEVINLISGQKGIPADTVREGMEKSLAEVFAKSKVDEDGCIPNIRVVLNGDDECSLGVYRVWEVVDNDTDLNGNQVSLDDAQKRYPEYSDIQIGDEIEEVLSDVEFSRNAYHQARQAFLRYVSEADRQKNAKNYIEKINTILYGKVKRVARDHVLLEVEEGIEGILQRRHMIDRDIFRNGDRVRALLIDVLPDKGISMLRFSRIEPQFLVELFKMEVPECAEGVIQIKAVARDPGIRSKIAVKSNDVRVDAVGACVGVRGGRIQSVMSELNNERIDVVVWDDDIAQFTINALAPSQIQSIIINETSRSMDVAVPADQLPIAIGKNGHNVKLASQLVGWQLNIMSLEQVETRQKNRGAMLLALFKDALDVDDDIANILIREGYGSLEELVSSSVNELSSIDEFDSDMSLELIDRAKQALVRQAIRGEVCEPIDLYELDGLSADLAKALVEKQVYTKESIAELSVDELCDLIEIDHDLAAALILAARKEWFDDVKDN